MMSNILEKTVGSFFTNSDSYTGLQGLFKQCIATKTKKEEAMIIQHHLSLLRERLKDPGIRPNFVGHCLAFVVFCDMLGYPAEFAHIHAINLTQQTTLPEKKMGYAASCCLLREGHDLCLLLVNTLVRDLASSNVAVIGLALSALCSAPLPSEATPTLLPALRDRLAHQTAYVRCRAVIAVHHLLKRHPVQCCHIVNNLVARLGDEDPHVVVRVLATLPDVIQVSPECVAGLVSPLVAIQRQILGGRLPADMVYQGIHAPWAQLNIIRVLPELALSEEEESAAKEVLLETLAQAGVKEGHVFEPPLRAALVSQTLTSLMSLEGPSESGRARAMTHVSVMLGAASSDVKHEGLQLLSLVLARHETSLNQEQREAVTSSLEHPDVTVRRRALALLAAGAGPSDVQTVCGQLFSQAASADSHLRSWLLEQALSLIEKFPGAVSSDWKLSALVKLLPLADEAETAQNILRTCQQLLTGGELKTDTRGKLLGVLAQHAQAKQAPTCLLALFVWTLGRFPDLRPDVDPEQDAVSSLVTLGNKILRNSKHDNEDLLLSVVQSCSKACENPTISVPMQPLTEFLQEVRQVNAELEAAAADLLRSLTALDQLRDALSHSPPPLDCTLSVLDQFVSEKLRSGQCRPYQPHMAAALLQARPRSPEVKVRSPEVPVQSPVQPAAASVASEDSWSVRSPEDAVSPEIPVRALVWGRHGRSRSPETVSRAATLSVALGGTSQVTRNVSGSTTSDDPLGDLLR